MQMICTHHIDIGLVPLLAGCAFSVSTGLPSAEPCVELPGSVRLMPTAKHASLSPGLSPKSTCLPAKIANSHGTGKNLQVPEVPILPLLPHLVSG